MLGRADIAATDLEQADAVGAAIPVAGGGCEQAVASSAAARRYTDGTTVAGGA